MKVKANAKKSCFLTSVSELLLHDCGVFGDPKLHSDGSQDPWDCKEQFSSVKGKDSSSDSHTTPLSACTPLTSSAWDATQLLLCWSKCCEDTIWDRPGFPELFPRLLNHWKQLLCVSPGSNEVVLVFSIPESREASSATCFASSFLQYPSTSWIWSLSFALQSSSSASLQKNLRRKKKH